MNLSFFAPGEYYHIYNRGVDRRTTFHTEKDLYRFIESMRIFNTYLDANEPISFYKRCQQNYTNKDSLVEIHQFCLMPNHFHLLLKEKQVDGISYFMQRLGTSYALFFNLKYKRTGHLFETGYKAKRIDSEAYFHQITRYIHLNPLSLLGFKWKTDGVKDKSSALEFLKSYQWSSFYTYYNNLDSAILNLSTLKGLFQTPEEHAKFIFDYRPPNILL